MNALGPVNKENGGENIHFTDKRGARSFLTLNHDGSLSIGAMNGSYVELSEDQRIALHRHLEAIETVNSLAIATQLDLRDTKLDTAPAAPCPKCGNPLFLSDNHPVFKQEEINGVPHFHYVCIRHVVEEALKQK